MNSKIKFLILSLFFCVMNMSLEKYENNTIYASVESEKIEIFDKEEIENSVNDDKDDEIAPYYIDQPDPPKV